MLFFLPKDWWSIVPSCFTSLQPYHAHWWSQSAHVSHPYSHVTYTDGSILLLCSHTYLTATSYPKVEPPTIMFTHLQPHHTQLWSFTHLQPHHTQLWSLLPSYSHTYIHVTPNCGASYHHVHTLTATSHPTVEPPTIMFTHLQLHHTQLWSLLPSCSHTYSYITPNCGASYHHVHTLTATSHPTVELHTLTATSHPTVEPPTIMFTHLQLHHTQLWSLLPSCSHTYSHITPNCGASHTYSHITPNCGASYHHVHTLTATSHPIVEPHTIMFTHLQPCHTQRWSIFTPVIHIHFTPWYVL